MDNVKSSSVATTLSVGSCQIVSSLLCIAALLPLAGCRICADCDEAAYAAYGGSWQRTVRDSGRVGSIFDPAGGLAPELSSRDTPMNPDELERERQDALDKEETDPDRMESYERPDSSDEEVPKDKADELRQRKLEDIEEEQEEELRMKELDDINVRVFPGQPMPPELR